MIGKNWSNPELQKGVTNFFLKFFIMYQNCVCFIISVPIMYAIVSVIMYAVISVLNMFSNYIVHKVKGSCQYGQSCKYYHPKKNLPNMNTHRMGGNISCFFFNYYTSRLVVHALCFAITRNECC